MSQPPTRNICLVSACLAGLCTRYDGRIKENRNCLKRLEKSTWIPVCPEQLGGLATPREPAELVGGDGGSVLAGTAKVITRSGLDVTPQFIKGANQVLEIAQRQGVTTVYLKAGSPSCGVQGIIGVTAALLQKHGFCPEEF
jgi:uncharacterized protein YbbK (DUF523 family)